jgi:hypothetical protein
MSAAHTWFGRSIATPRSRYGKILCPGAGFVVLGFGPSAAMPIVRISRCTRLGSMRCPSVCSIAAMRREPRNRQTVNSSSSRCITARSLSFAGWRRYTAERATPSRAHCRRIDSLP